MNRIGYILVGGMLLYSCHMLKRQVKSESLRQTTQISNMQEKQYLLLIRDSLRNSSVAEIVPAGNFSYSPIDGFKGSASHVKITGNSDKVLERLEKSQTKKVHQQQQVEQKNNTVKVKEQFKVGINLYIYALVMVLAVWLWWKYR